MPLKQLQLPQFAVEKRVLSNGLTVLMRPTRMVPEVEVQLWYNVGSKDERDGERGMAHLIEHMIFKGSKLLSESDINMVTHKLSGYTNAFTSFDYTTYVFRMPKHVWQHSLTMLADCMQHTRFDEQMLASELKAVIQELKMYRDDYHGGVVEQLMASVFPEHPYHHPIIGYKQDLWSLNRDHLYAFYRRHYHPGNATLVLVGDFDPDEAMRFVEKEFGAIPAVSNYKKTKFFTSNDVVAKSVTLYREVEAPWCCYAYKISGLTGVKSHIYYLATLLFGRGKSSILYDVLVNQKRIATDVSCFTYDLFDDELFFIAVDPTSQAQIPKIEATIDECFARVQKEGIEPWQYSRIHKRAQMDFLALLENNEQQAIAIGNSYLATGDEQYLTHYFERLAQTSADDLVATCGDAFRPTVRHKGYLLAAPAQEKPHLAALQVESDALDQKILEKRERITPVEAGRWEQEVPHAEPVAFTYPKPEEIRLSNGLVVLYYHNPSVPKISVGLSFKADFLFDTKERSGLSQIHAKMLLEGTRAQPSRQLHQYLESEGIYIYSKSGLLNMEFLAADLHKGLAVLMELLTTPRFEAADFERILENAQRDLDEYWDTPSSFITQLVRDLIYRGHPYQNNVLGTKESVAAITVDDVRDYHRRFISPDGAIIAIVGDLSAYASAGVLQRELEESIGRWQGEPVADLVLPKIPKHEAQVIAHQMQRDQVALGFVAPSISRLDPAYDALSLLDIILIGGQIGTMSSRLFALREQTGLFYTVGGSLTHHAGKAPGMVFIKTIVSPDKTDSAIDAIKNTLNSLVENGVENEEFLAAKNALIQASIGHYENNGSMVNVFLFLKKFDFSFDLFDKRGSQLSILNIENLQELAARYCNPKRLSIIKVGRGVR